MINIKIDNTFNLVNSPIILAISELVDIDNHKYQRLISPSRISLVALDSDTVIINNTTFTCLSSGSHSVQVFIDGVFVQLFSIYVFVNLATINQQNLYYIFAQELPQIYSNNNVYNEADNYAISQMFNDFYQFMYEAYYNSFMSLGQDASYNVNLEELYFSTKGILANTKSPAQILKLLKQVKSQTGISYKQLSIFLSKLLYAAIGREVPISIHQLNANSICNIDIYYAPSEWRLGVAGYSELGVTTILGRPLNTNIINVLVLTMCNRLMPCNVKWQINYFSLPTFKANFNYDAVPIDAYIDDDVIYDAYNAVNNNNVFNTKGYYRNV